ncbi:MAG: hypothetical protein OXR66_09075 [Candidatus Woesearchaeota archaeon]|nr:hypothetical protein [Candidatus Woesearchaeota archaeon]
MFEGYTPERLTKLKRTLEERAEDPLLQQVLGREQTIKGIVKQHYGIKRLSRTRFTHSYLAAVNGTPGKRFCSARLMEPAGTDHHAILSLVDEFRDVDGTYRDDDALAVDHVRECLSAAHERREGCFWSGMGSTVAMPATLLAEGCINELLYPWMSKAYDAAHALGGGTLATKALIAAALVAPAVIAKVAASTVFNRLYEGSRQQELGSFLDLYKCAKRADRFMLEYRITQVLLPKS